MLKLIRNEAQIGAVWLTAALFLIFGSGWFAAAASNTGLTLLLFAWLFAAILWGPSAWCAMPSISPRRSASPTER